MTQPPTPHLQDLARRHGIAVDYWSWQGEHQPVSAASLVAVLAALGVDADGPDAVGAAIDAHERAQWARRLPPTVVVRAGTHGRVRVHAAAGGALRVGVELEEGGTRDLTPVRGERATAEFDGRRIERYEFETPADLPLGWHWLVAEADDDGSPERRPLVVVPDRLELPAGLATRRAIGIATQLYQVRSERSWGMGDLGDLHALAEWAAREHGADFILVNPLHAAEPTPPVEPSPYLPTTRRWVNPLYLDVDAVDHALGGPGVDEVASLAALARGANAEDVIDRDRSWALKSSALRLIFDSGRDPGGVAEFEAFRAAQGAPLERFATWCALAARLGLPPTRWADGIRHPGPEAAAAADPGDVEFYAWLQWLAAGQLARAQAAARAAGMRLGVVHDLAVGVHPHGADAWATPDLLAEGVRVGAPPDQFNQLGQDWSQPPWRPDRLAEAGYLPFRDMVRAILADAGGVRIDHVIGLSRLWWIPAGCQPNEGAYVHYDFEALIGILALEAHRADAVIIGEDLGVVEPAVREHLAERGMLGTSILWFEWDGDSPRPPESYRDLCLAAVTTHDLPPTAGYLGLEHVGIRERLGLLTRPVADERAAETASIERFTELLRERGLLGPDPAIDDIVVALHRLLARSPSRMLVASLADLVGDTRAINQPGTADEYPNWRLPLAGPGRAPLDWAHIRASPIAGPIMAALREPPR